MAGACFVIWIVSMIARALASSCQPPSGFISAHSFPGRSIAAPGLVQQLGLIWRRTLQYVTHPSTYPLDQGLAMAAKSDIYRFGCL